MASFGQAGMHYRLSGSENVIDGITVIPSKL